MSETASTTRSRTLEWSDPVATAAAGAELAGIDYLRAVIAGELGRPPISITMNMAPIELEVVQVPAAASDDHAALGTIGVDELLRARRRMVELARVLADEDVAHFPATDDPDACTYCAYLNSCRARPMRREDRFGR